MEPKPFDCPIVLDRPPTPVAELSERITKALAESRRVIAETHAVLVRGWALLDRYRADRPWTIAWRPGPSMSANARGEHHD